METRNEPGDDKTIAEYEAEISAYKALSGPDKRVVDFKKMSTPHTYGTVSEIQAATGWSKAKIRRLKREGQLAKHMPNPNFDGDVINNVFMNLFDE